MAHQKKHCLPSLPFLTIPEYDCISTVVAALSEILIIALNKRPTTHFHVPQPLTTVVDVCLKNTHTYTGISMCVCGCAHVNWFCWHQTLQRVVCNWQWVATRSPTPPKPFVWQHASLLFVVAINAEFSYCRRNISTNTNNKSNNKHAFGRQFNSSDAYFWLFFCACICIFHFRATLITKSDRHKSTKSHLNYLKLLNCWTSWFSCV